MTDAAPTLTLTDLALGVQQRTGLPYAAALDAARALVDTIADQLAGGTTVTLRGFGSFLSRDLPGRHLIAFKCALPEFAEPTPIITGSAYSVRDDALNGRR